MNDIRDKKYEKYMSQTDDKKWEDVYVHTVYGNLFLKWYAIIGILELCNFWSDAENLPYCPHHSSYNYDNAQN